MKARRLCICLAPVALINASAMWLSAQTTSTWSLAGDGNWADAANWDTTAFPNNGQPLPGDTYNAALNTNRIITLDQDVTIQGFTQSTGTVTGAAARTLTLEDTFAWSGGTLTGGMTVHANGGASVSSDVVHHLGGGTIFNNNGTMTWTQGHIGNSSESWTFNNTASGIINVNLITFPGAFGALSGGKTINNAGTINVATATHANYLDFQSPLNNSGLVDVTGSYIIMRGGTNTGQIQVAAGRTAQFSSSNFTQSGTGSITGAGHVQGVGGGTITFGTGTTYNVGSTWVHSSDMAFNNAATTGTLTLNNTGRLFGAGSITATGLFTWTGAGGFPGYSTGIYDSLQINAQGGMLMNGTNKHILGGGRINNSGAAVWTSGNLIFKETGGTATTALVNQAGGTLDMQFDGSIIGGGSNVNTNFFTNSGTFTKSGGIGTSAFSVIVTNTSTGLMEIDSGTLSIWTLNNAGSIEVGSGAALTFQDHFSGSSYTQTAGSLILSDGSVTKSGSALAINGGSVGGNGTITGNLAFNSSIIDPGLSAGTLTIMGNLAVTSNTTFQFELGGTTQGSEYDFISHTGSLQFDLANSLLNLSLINALVPDALDTFTLFSSNNAILGTFGNLDSFGRYHFTEGSFQVDVIGSSIILSNFITIPESSSALLLATSCLMACSRRRR